jgi:hypothetical protein
MSGKQAASLGDVLQQVVAVRLPVCRYTFGGAPRIQPYTARPLFTIAIISQVKQAIALADLLLQQLGPQSAQGSPGPHVSNSRCLQHACSFGSLK